MSRESAAHGAIERRRIMERIGLLCQIGTGLEGIAIPLCHAIRDLIGADSASVFWLSADRVPVGFYHDSAPAEIWATIGADGQVVRMSSYRQG